MHNVSQEAQGPRDGRGGVGAPHLYSACSIPTRLLAAEGDGEGHAQEQLPADMHPQAKLSGGQAAPPTGPGRRGTPATPH